MTESTIFNKKGVLHGKDIFTNHHLLTLMNHGVVCRAAPGFAGSANYLSTNIIQLFWFMTVLRAVQITLVFQQQPRLDSVLVNMNIVKKRIMKMLPFKISLKKYMIKTLFPEEPGCWITIDPWFIDRVRVFLNQY